jgi:hypothetical protein
MVFLEAVDTLIPATIQFKMFCSTDAISLADRIENLVMTFSPADNKD